MMDFLEIARARQSCRSYDTERPVEQEKLDAVLEAARLAPSACNAQPYHFHRLPGAGRQGRGRRCDRHGHEQVRRSGAGANRDL